MEQHLRIRQGMQPSFGGVLVGIVKIGVAGGAPAIQVWIRTAEHEFKQAFREGESIALPGAGTLRFDAIRPADDPQQASADLAFAEDPGT
jgi:hypothetical protein